MKSSRTGFNTRGNIALYLVLLLPILIGLVALAIDFSEWTAYRNAVQQAADRIAVQAANALPNTDRAYHLSQSLAEESFGAGIITKATYDGIQFQLALSSNYKPRTFTALSALFPHLSKPLTIDRASSVQIRPLDLVLILSDARTLRPNAERDSNGQWILAAPWGDELQWPTSHYFDCAGPPLLTDELVVGPWSHIWNSTPDRRWFTQACFNPAFSALKEAGLQTVRAIKSLPSHRLAVVFSPGTYSGRNVSTLRHLRSEVIPENPLFDSAQRGGFFPTAVDQAEAYWNHEIDPTSLTSDTFCYLLSHPIHSADTPYALPTSISSSCVTSFESSVCGSRYNPGLSLSQCYEDRALTLEEAIYWKAAKLPFGTFTAKFSLVAALQQALTEFSSAPNAEYLRYEQSVRGNIAPYAKKLVLAITDNIDQAELQSPALASLFETFRKNEIEFELILFQHEYLSRQDSTTLQDANISLSTHLRSALPNLHHVSLVSTRSEFHQLVAFLSSSATRDIILRR